MANFFGISKIMSNFAPSKDPAIFPVSDDERRMQSK